MSGEREELKDVSIRGYNMNIIWRFEFLKLKREGKSEFFYVGAVLK